MKNYIFDLYGTLVDIHTDEEKQELWEKLAFFYGYYGAIYTPEELKQRYKELVEGKESAQRMLLERTEEKKDDVHEAHPEIKIEEVFLNLFIEKGVKADLTLAMHAGQFFRILSTEYVRLYDGVKSMLSMLKEAGKKVYLLSNAQRIFTEYEMNMLGITEYFDDIFISSECGTKKPDLRFFQMLMEKHELDQTESIMIGNDMKSDIGGARKVGIATFYIHSNISPELPKEAVTKENGEKLEVPVKPEADFVLMQMDMKKVAEILKDTF